MSVSALLESLVMLPSIGQNVCDLWIMIETLKDFYVSVVIPIRREM